MNFLYSIFILWLSTLPFGKIDTGSVKEIIFLDTTQSLVEQFKQFENNPILIDSWSVNCAPCIEQFKYMKQLDEYLLSNDIVTLYLCIGIEEYNLETWKALIEENDLTGYHVFVSRKNWRDYKIGFNIDGEENFIRLGHNFPFYVIVKEGENNAKKIDCLPVEKEEFIKQINEFLN